MTRLALKSAAQQVYDAIHAHVEKYGTYPACLEMTKRDIVTLRNDLGTYVATVVDGSTIGAMTFMGVEIMEIP
jgi:hypothetical protein